MIKELLIDLLGIIVLLLFLIFFIFFTFNILEVLKVYVRRTDFVNWKITVKLLAEG